MSEVELGVSGGVSEFPDAMEDRDDDAANAKLADPATEEIKKKPEIPVILG